MKLYTTLAAVAALTLVAACSSPFEYSTYHPKSSRSSYMPSMPSASSMKFWQSDDKNTAAKAEDGVIKAQMSDDVPAPMDIKAPQGRVSK